MRGNGLSAASYVAIADLEPGITDRLLELLRDAQIAAKAEPGDDTSERLLVDADAEDRARALIEAELTDSEDAADTEGSAPTTELDEDKAWAEIIAGYDRDEADPVARWPVSEDRGPDTDDVPASAADDGPEPQFFAVRKKAEEDDDEPEIPEVDRFVPPTPPPLPRLDPVTKAAGAAMAAGPVLLVFAAVTEYPVPPWLMVLGTAAFVGGFIALVMRMKSGPPDDDDGGVV